MSKLSPGDWNKRILKEYQANLRFRKKLLALCRADKAAQRAVWLACKNDFLFFVNCFIYQYNPLSKEDDVRVGPFVTWDFQDKVMMMEPPVGKGIMWCYENDRTAVIEKSRDMGASWLFLIFQVWLFLFHDDVQSLNISRNADAVDSKSKNSLFTKIRFILEHIPDWLKGSCESLRFFFECDTTRSEITGEASTGRSGAGGRATVVFIDEFSKIKEDVEVRATDASTSDCRFFNGTHEGVSTEFYNLTEDAKKYGGIILIQMHWTRHPKKNTHLYSWDQDAGKIRYWSYDGVWDEIVETQIPDRPFPEDYNYDRTGAPSGGPHPGIRSIWYDKKAEEIGTDRGVAMELDINASGSGSQFYEARVIASLKAKCRDPLWTGELDFDTETTKPIQFVPGDGDLKLWIEPQLYDGKIIKVQPSTYVVSGDISFGTGSTPTCFTIFDVLRGIKVGAYASSWKDPKMAAPIAVALARAFPDIADQPALLAWEVPGPGYIFGDIVMNELRYKNVFWNIIDSFAGEQRESDKPGWYANTKTKLELHSKYLIALKTGEFVNWDKPALEETLSYVHSRGTVEHPKGKKNDDASAEGSNHGDRVVADALAWLMAKRIGPRVEPDIVPLVSAVPNTIAGRREWNRIKARQSESIWERS